MKTKILLTPLLLLSVGAVIYFSAFHSTKNQRVYVPREAENKVNIAGWKGAEEFYQRVVANQVTGRVDPNEVQKAWQQVQMMAKHRSASLGLQWSDMGPDNVGGRTRAILVDKNNSSRVWAGGITGGLFYSNDGGANWQAWNDQFTNLIVSCITQSPNGDIYFGTGCDFEGFGNFWPGWGIFKITPGGAVTNVVLSAVTKYTVLSSYYPITNISIIKNGVSVNVANSAATFIGLDTMLKSAIGEYKVFNTTIQNLHSLQEFGNLSFTDKNGVAVVLTPSTDYNNTSFDWSAVNKIVVNPTKPNEIYVASHKGLRVSDDFGFSWKNPISTDCSNKLSTIETVAYDVEITSDGSRLFVSLAGQLYYSDNPMVCSSYIKNLTLPVASGRMDIAVAPSDANKAYSCNVNSNSSLGAIYRSVDKGTTWTMFIPAFSSDPMCSSAQCQGVYDLAFAVAPNDPDKLFIGGVQLWKYDGAPAKIAHEGGNYDNFSDPYYVHADKHTFAFDPNNPNTMYVGCDGGVFKSFSQGTVFFQINKKYSVTQFYKIGFNSGIECDSGKIRDLIIGGTQDNGSMLLGVPGGNTPLRAKRLTGGDGFGCDMSLITGAMFTTIYNIQVYRAICNGDAFGQITDPDTLQNSSVFNTRLRLWENDNDYTSKSLINFKNDTLKQGIGVGNGIKIVFTGKLVPLQAAGKIKPGTVLIKAGTVTLTDNGSGVLSGGGNGSVNYTSGDFTVTFNTAPANNLNLWAYYFAYYKSADMLSLTSNTPGVPVKHLLTSDLNPGDSVSALDPIQSVLAIGASPTKNTGNFTTSDRVLITRDALNMTVNPTWIGLGFTIGAAFSLSSLEFSKDGNILYVGIDGTGVYRITGINKVYAKADVSANITKTLIYSTSRAVTGIAVDQTNKERVVVTLGNYGNTSYVFFSGNAASATNVATAAFKDVTGNLPKMPVYDAEISIINNKNVVIGTEYGIFSTQDIAASSVSWADDNSSMHPRVPVYEVRQRTFFPERRSYSNISGAVVKMGAMFTGTHGRGAWKSNSLSYDYNVGTDEPNAKLQTSRFISGISVYPNPMSSAGTVSFQLKEAVEGTITIYDIYGRSVYSAKKQFAAGTNLLPVNSSLASGTYFVAIEAKESSAVAKFVVMK